MALVLLQNVNAASICIATCAAGTIGGTAIAVPALGFTSVGVAAGSIAAWFQSAFLGSFIAPGSMFAALQSMGVTGMTYTAYARLIATCTATCVATFGHY